MSFHRRVIIKASIKKMSGGGRIGLKKHIAYIQRDGTDERGERAEIYGAGAELDASEKLSVEKSFSERCGNDRHHFRFIISPEDADQLTDMTGYTRDLVSKMESSLSTKLEWVAANHYDTANPHTHLIVRGVRDDGRDLVIPRRYMAFGMRADAQEIAEIELGPVTRIEGRVRLARTVEASRVTDLDRTLARDAKDQIVDLSGPAKKGQVWHRQLLKRRLRRLSAMEMAEPLGGGRWKLEPDALQRLQKIEEREDIVKTLHRAMTERGEHQLITERNLYDPTSPMSLPVTGLVHDFGRPDDTVPGAYVIVERPDTSLLYAKIGEDEIFDTLRKGQVVTLSPHSLKAKSIDHSLDDFARRHAGRYSAAKQLAEGGVSPEYAQAHNRRLEAFGRQRIVSRNSDGSWRIPGDFIARAADFEIARAQRLSAPVSRSGNLTIKQMETARGATWLDKQLVAGADPSSFSRKIQASLTVRAGTLEKMGFTVSSGTGPPRSLLDNLKNLDLEEAGASLSTGLGKPYSGLENERTVEGIYKQAVDRPSGKFAVIERAHDFTLVPWRPVMERRLGKSISGSISKGGISWDVTGRSGPGR